MFWKMTLKQKKIDIQNIYVLHPYLVAHIIIKFIFYFAIVKLHVDFKELENKINKI